MDNVLVGANGINDLEMLDLAAGSRVLVGPEDERNEIKGYLSRVDELILLDGPEKLGEYLQNIG